MEFDFFSYGVCLVEILTFHVLFRIIDGRRFNLLNYIVSYAVIALGAIAVTFLYRLSYAVLLVNYLVIFIGFAVGFRRKFTETLFNSLLVFLVFLYLQIITLTYTPMSMLGTNWGNLFADSTILIAVLIFNIFAWKFHFAEAYKNNFKLVWIVLASLCVPTVIICQYIAATFTASTRQTIIILVLLQFVYLLAIIALASVIKHRNKAHLLSQTNKHIDELNSHLDESRKSMHDFNKHIKYLHNMVMTSSSDETLQNNVDAYCKDLFDYYNDEEILLQLDDPIYRALLYGRRNQAKQNSIDFILDATPVLPKFPVESFKFVEIFDNLMDNAFEHVSMLTENKWIKVALNFEDLGDSQRHTLIIQNPCQDTDISLILKNKPYTTKGGKHMGLGLKKVAKLVKDAGGIFLISCDNNVFAVSIVFTENNI